jgi:cytochrome c oxidase assembly protein subunit 15
MVERAARRFSSYDSLAMTNVDASAARRFSRFGWALLAYTIFVVAFGAWVRITGSGAGCGQHWPTCHGQIVPRSPSTATIIEFSHRLTSGLYGILVLVLLVWAIRRFPRGHLVRAASWLTLVFTITEALVGAGLVKLSLVADDASVARAAMMAVHLVNTSFLTGTLALACWAAGDPGERGRLRVHDRRGIAGLLLGCVVALVIVGMSGAVTALGDTLFPVVDSSAPLADRLGADQAAGAHFLQRMRALHPVLAIGVGVLVLFTAERLVGRAAPGTGVHRFGRIVSLAVVLQVGAGAVNVMLSAPGWMQIVHLVLGTLLWIAVVLLTASALSGSAPFGSPTASTASRVASARR